METTAVAVNPVDYTVFAAAGNITNGGNPSLGTGLLRSADCGATWQVVNTGTGVKELSTGDPWAVIIDPKAPQTMYLDNGYGSPPTLFKTTDGGTNWLGLNPDTDNVLGIHNFAQAIAIDPANHLHLAMTFHDDCKAPYNKMCLSQSTDAGATWKEFNGPAAVSGWIEGASLTILGPISYFLTCSQGGYYTADGGKNWSKVINSGIFGSYGGGAITLPDGSLLVGVAGDAIYSSKANGGMPVGSVWTKIPGTPNTSVMIQEGTNIYASYSNDNSGAPFYVANVSDPTKWTHMDSKGIARGANMFAYDDKHHVLYAANWGAGLWRVVTQ